MPMYHQRAPIIQRDCFPAFWDGDESHAVVDLNGKRPDTLGQQARALAVRWCTLHKIGERLVFLPLKFVNIMEVGDFIIYLKVVVSTEGKDILPVLGECAGVEGETAERPGFK